MGSLKGQRNRGELMNSKSVDYTHHHTGGGGGGRGMNSRQAKRMRSKSTDQLHTDGAGRGSNGNCRIDSGTLKKMLKPVHTAPESPVTSPEGGRNRRIMMMGSSADARVNGHDKHNGYMGGGSGDHGGRGPNRGGQYDSDRDGFMSEPESNSRLRAARAAMGKQPQPPQQGNMYHRDIGRPSTGNNSLHKNSGGRNLNRGQLYLDFNDRQNAASPPSDSGKKRTFFSIVY